MNPTAKQIAQALKAKGLEVLAVHEGDDGVDGEVAITSLVSVQVGFLGDYLIVSVDKGEEFEHFPTRTSAQIDAVVEDIRAALAA